MVTLQKNITDTKVQDIFKKIDNLDLEPIKHKLMNPEEGAWSLAKCDAVEITYKQYLKLVAVYPNLSIVPSKNDDKMWHAHILDTAKYLEDCMNIFGYFLHHFPYFGVRSEEDKANLAQAFSVTQNLRKLHFGESEKIYPTQSQCNAICGDGYIEASKCNAVCGDGYIQTSKCNAVCGDGYVTSQASVCEASDGTNVCHVDTDVMRAIALPRPRPQR